MHFSGFESSPDVDVKLEKSSAWAHVSCRSLLISVWVEVGKGFFRRQIGAASASGSSVRSEFCTAEVRSIAYAATAIRHRPLLGKITWKTATSDTFR